MIVDRGEELDKMEAHQQLIKILEAVNWVSHDLHDISSDSDSCAIKALFDLRTASSSIFSSNPLQFSISQLADSVQELHNSKPSAHGLISFLTRRVKSHEISRLAVQIESEIQALIDRESVSTLTTTLAGMHYSSVKEESDEGKVLDEMSVLQKRLSRGFNINLQDLLLKSGILWNIEWVLCNPILSKRVREKAAMMMKDLILFNKDVFVGSVLVGGSIKALLSTDSLCFLRVVSSLIKAIKSPLVDEMKSCGGISNIVCYLSSKELEIRLMAMDCVMEIGYFGRKEAVEDMLDSGLIEKLVELQRFEGDKAKCREKKNKKKIKNPFARCVARFAVQLEVGEGLRQREKRDFKLQILKRVKESCVKDDGESATILAEVLWGTSP